MKSQGGWNLLELTIVVAVLSLVGGTFLGVASTIRQDERYSNACATDLHELRRAARQIEDDLRAGRDLREVGYVLKDGRLARGTRMLARNIARFDVKAQDDITRVALALGPRSDAPLRKQAALDVVVRHRTGGAK